MNCLENVDTFRAWVVRQPAPPSARVGGRHNANTYDPTPGDNPYRFVVTSEQPPKPTPGVMFKVRF